MTGKVTSKGQVTIPKEVRERVGLRPGDHLRFTVTKDGAIHAEPLDSRGSPRSLAGYLNDRIAATEPIDLDEMAEAMKEAVAAHVIASLR